MGLNLLFGYMARRRGLRDAPQVRPVGVVSEALNERHQLRGGGIRQELAGQDRVLCATLRCGRPCRRSERRRHRSEPFPAAAYGPSLH